MTLRRRYLNSARPCCLGLYGPRLALLATTTTIASVQFVSELHCYLDLGARLSRAAARLHEVITTLPHRLWPLIGLSSAAPHFCATPELATLGAASLQDDRVFTTHSATTPLTTFNLADATQRRFPTTSRLSTSPRLARYSQQHALTGSPTTTQRTWFLIGLSSSLPSQPRRRS